ncbi:hypothetical protein DPMN_127636 [Dreissena polymorpha]|uniref:Uncharacterized protein n=1 Tax=Dreissena polymorpha TaxID=45954 RepID=A0A9D4JV10_DREPO|nr:hypothetical protein DPMN_127636 [Dreissena polymorpha]
MLKPHDGRRTMDKRRSQQLTMSTWSPGLFRILKQIGCPHPPTPSPELRSKMVSFHKDIKRKIFDGSSSEQFTISSGVKQG